MSGSPHTNGSALRQIGKPTKKSAKRIAQRLGLEIRRYDAASPDQHRQRTLLFERLGISVVLDVGANVGQYAGRCLRDWSSFAGQIESFEPVESSYRACRELAGRDPLWRVHHLGLSDRAGSATIDVYEGATDLSSLSPMTPAGRAVISVPATAEEVRLRRLDDLFDELVEEGARVALKLDVQGHEAAVLRGARQALARVAFLECEAPLVPMYEGSLSFAELLAFIGELGFLPVGARTNQIDPSTGIAMDADVYFVHSTAAGELLPA